MFLILAGVLLTAGLLFVIHAESVGNRLRAKAAQVKAGVVSWAAEGRDATAVLALVDRVKAAIDAGDPQKADALLDRALTILSSPKTGDTSPLPVYAEHEATSDLFGKLEPVAIEGYNGSAMEPFISPDGKTLFFNNANDPGVNTNLYFAKRTGKLSFRYLGELPGVNSEALDAVPSIDTQGHFYFTSLRDYDRTRDSLYIGDFDGHRVKNVHPVPGNISPTAAGSVNMDACISPDGRTLYISRASPQKSVLIVARLKNGAFTIDPDSDRIMRNINTPALQYAPAISADERTLYFTRASQSRPGSNAPGAYLRIMFSTRAASKDPFGEPRALTALNGFVEAPTVTLDGSEMFFHKKVGGKCVIYRATGALAARAAANELLRRSLFGLRQFTWGMKFETSTRS